MLSFTQLQTLYGQVTQNNSADNLAYGAQIMNIEQRYLLQKYFSNEATYSITTVAQQQVYKLPPDYSKLKSDTLTIGNLKWTPTEILTIQDWNNLNVFPYYADIPAYFFIYQNQFQLWPIPATGSTASTYTGLVGTLNVGDTITVGSVTGTILSFTSTQMVIAVNNYATLGTGAFTTSGSASGTISANTVTPGNTITFNYKRRIPDLSLADYSVGTVSVNQNGLAVTGSGTTFIPTVNLITESRWIQFPQNSGDNLWYEIKSVDSTTGITLYAPYMGSNISGGTYVLGQMPILIEDFHDMLVWKAAATYFTSIVDNKAKRDEFEDLYNKKLELMEEYAGTKTINVNLSRPPLNRNPNLYPQNIG